jgi:hypothetical protein
MDDVFAVRCRRVASRLHGAFCICALSLVALHGAFAQAPKGLTRDDLIGAWRLVRIEYSGPHGSTVDPFYQAGSSGLLIYDKSGWMSVDIAAPDRARFEVPSQRRAMRDGGELSALKLAAFDSYYAYHGTWEFDAATSVVTHHVASSLLPAESGVIYTQKVSLEGGHLVFTNRSGAAGEETVRLKIWERIIRH